MIETIKKLTMSYCQVQIRHDTVVPLIHNTLFKIMLILLLLAIYIASYVIPACCFFVFVLSDPGILHMHTS